MEYDEKIWNSYTDENDLDFQNPAKFIYHISLALGAKKILEVGCNVGHNLKEFTTDFEVHGIDLNSYALEKCKNRFNSFTFQKASLTDIPYPDSFFDLVFTRIVLIHVPPEQIQKAMSELLRVSKKWILNLEFYNESEDMIDWKRGKDLLWYRNMKKGGQDLM